jgi:hypothetical protein
MASLLNWLKRWVIKSDSGFEVRGTIRLGYDISEPATRPGKSPFGGVIEKAIAESGAEPGDLVEIDEHGAARVVGRRPRLAGEGEQGDTSEQGIRARLKAIYGDDAAYLADVTAGANVVVFRKPNQT